MAAVRELVRKSRLERSEDMLATVARHIQSIEKHAKNQDEAREFLWATLERRTLKGRWGRLVKWLQ
jgi:hypothetical protein